MRSPSRMALVGEEEVVKKMKGKKRGEKRTNFVEWTGGGERDAPAVPKQYGAEQSRAENDACSHSTERPPSLFRLPEVGYTSFHPSIPSLPFPLSFSSLSSSRLRKTRLFHFRESVASTNNTSHEVTKPQQPSSPVSKAPTGVTAMTEMASCPIYHYACFCFPVRNFLK